MTFRTLIFWSAFFIIVPQFGQAFQDLQLIDRVDKTNVLVAYENYDTGGNTSVENDSTFVFKWSGKAADKAGGHGYFNKEGEEIPYLKRKRDLGQTFTYTGDNPAKITALVLRTGYGSNAVRKKMYGQRLSIQFLEVSGTAQINTNGSEEGSQAYHGFPHDRNKKTIPSERDDYFTGEHYKHLAVFRGYTFPVASDFGIEDKPIGIDPKNPKLKGRLLRFTFPEDKAIVLEPDKTYAFMVMIDDLTPDAGFTLANNYNGSYKGGHGIRREGKGVFPPVPAEINYPIGHKKNSIPLNSSILPYDFEERLQQPPGTNGYPDVDTWRDLNFYLEGLEIR